MRILCLALLLLTGCALAKAAPPDAGLVLYYPFNGDTKDHSGNGFDGRIIGGAEWVKGDFGSALQFNGKDGFIDCGPTGEKLDVAAGGTVMIWAHPKKVQGGLVGWNMDTSWEGARLILAIDTYHGGAETLGCMSDGKKYGDYRGWGSLPKNEWTHVAYTFDGKTINMYRDGVRVKSSTQPVRADVKGVHLWIGKCLGLGVPFFGGLLDEVRIYKRALSGDEVLALYKTEAKGREKDLSLFRRPALDVNPYPDPGKISAMMDARGMQPLPAGSLLRAELCVPGAAEPKSGKVAPKIYKTDPSEVIFAAEELPAGDYEVRASVVGPDGARIGDVTTAALKWPGRNEVFKRINVLNNLCWEFINEQDVAAEKKTFTLPYGRWGFVRSVAELGNGASLRVGLDSRSGNKGANLHSTAGETTLETMRYLEAGTHTVQITRNGDAKLKHLIVRAIPALEHAFYGANVPRVRAHGNYRLEFMRKYVCPHVNVMLAGLDHYRGAQAFEFLEEWTGMGREWITYKDIPRDLVSQENAAQRLYEYWAKTTGMKNPLVNGIMVDEFLGGDRPDYDIFSEAVKKLYADPKLSGGFHPWCDLFYAMDRSTKFGRVCMDGGGYLHWEVYLQEPPTQEEALRRIQRRITALMPKWEKALPGCTRRMVLAFGIMCAPPESLNGSPEADYKVFQDLQFRTVATHPAFFGLGGFQEYHSGYSDEESLRWVYQMYRHYAIEGNREPLNDDPYELPHIKNPNFADGTNGWRVTPAEPNSIQVKSHVGYGDRTGTVEEGVGNTFLWMQRSAKKPNVFSQDIKALTPARLYCMKMITSDYQEMAKGKSAGKNHAVSIKLDNVNIMPGQLNSFQFPMSRRGNVLNYHWRVFRANGTTGKLTVSDWESEDTPGGPPGQELIFNFIEIQPYFPR